MRYADDSGRGRVILVALLLAAFAGWSTWLSLSVRAERALVTERVGWLSALQSVRSDTDALTVEGGAGDHWPDIQARVTSLSAQIAAAEGTHPELLEQIEATRAAAERRSTEALLPAMRAAAREIRVETRQISIRLGSQWSSIQVLVLLALLLSLVTFVVYLAAVRRGRELRYSNQRLVEEAEQRREAEAQLAAQEAHSRALLDAVPDGILLLDAQQRIGDVRGPVIRTLGWPAAELNGKRLDEVFSQKSVEGLALLTALVRGDNAPPPYEFEHYGRQLEARAVLAGDGETLLMLRDVSERHTVERLRDAMITRINHELRTPLTSMRGALGLIAGGAAGELNDQARELFEIAHRNAEQLVRLTGDILELRRISSDGLGTRREAVDLAQLLREVVDSARSEGEARQVRLCLDLDVDGPTWVRAERARLVDAIARVLARAISASPPEEEVALTLRVQGRALALDIRDHGLDVRDAAELLEAQGNPGDALSLTVVRAVVRELGGEISASEAPGGGCVAHLVLPLGEPPSAEEDQGARRPTPTSTLGRDEPPEGMNLT